MKKLIGWLRFYWHQFRVFSIIETLFAVAGALWGVVEALAFFGQDTFSLKLQKFWWLFILLTLLLTIVMKWPKRKFRFKINGRDVYVSIQLGDILSFDESAIVTINNRFEVDPLQSILNSKSILGSLVNRFFNKSPGILQAQINGCIAQNEFYNNFRLQEDASQYKIGTVVPVSVNGRQIYLLANTKLNKNKRSVSSDEDLRNALAELWSYIATTGTKDTLAMPVIGTGMGRLNMTRERVIKEIILSFIASVGYQTYCNELIVVVHPMDYSSYDLNLEHIINFMKLQCEYYEPPTSMVPQGQAIN